MAKNISKTFGATKALENVTVEFESGQVRALVGENGAGKSTLLKIVASLYKQDAGTMTLDGKPYDPNGLMDASNRGVTIVFQETTINPYLTIAENIFIDRLRNFKNGLGLINWKEMRNAAQKILNDMHADIDVNQDIWKLDLGQWKIIEIARALSYKPKVLMFDESTAFLNTKEANAFLNVVDKLKAEGIAMGFVSHHLNEVFRIADTITVMKDGKMVSDHKADEIDADRIQALMVGRDIGSGLYPERKINFEKSVPILSLEKISVDNTIQDVDLTLHEGEILGIGGLKGSGGDAVLQTIFGDLSYTSGKMTYEGKKFHPKKPYHSLKSKIALVPGERTLEGLNVNFSVMHNLSVSNIPKKGPFIDKKTELNNAKKYIKDLTIKASSPQIECSSLSGGNTQKVVIGKCLATNPKVLLLNNPTRGIDVGARFEIYNVINKLALDGMAIILLSEDLPELIGMSDRIMIMRKGRVSGTFDLEKKPTEEEIIRYML
ncbi:MAG: sugar ABC transporter ATP-binding protein [Bacillota bacterium]|nr:sugar ABC transporter ATP-binding protein [Bacillota bacterium]